MEGDHKHKIMDRPFMPKYGTVSQVLLQLVVAYNLLMSLLEESIKSVRLVIFAILFYVLKALKS